MYFLQFYNDVDGDEFDDDDIQEVVNRIANVKICRSAYKVILDIGRYQWDTLRNCANKNVVPSHGLKSRRSNNGKMFDTYIKQDLITYLKELEELGTPPATRVVREIAGTGLRDEERGVVELPCAFTKQGLYTQSSLTIEDGT